MILSPFLSMKHNKKWFTLYIVLIIITIFAFVSTALIDMYHTNLNGFYVAHKKIQAKNYVIEWIELFKWYVQTEINKDKKWAWDEVIQPLYGSYIVWFNDSVYSLSSWSEEVIEQDEPYTVDYIRTISIQDGDDSNEKKVTVTVDYWEANKVSFETSIVNLY